MKKSKTIPVSSFFSILIFYMEHNSQKNNESIKKKLFIYLILRLITIEKIMSFIKLILILKVFVFNTTIIILIFFIDILYQLNLQFFQNIILILI